MARLHTESSTRRSHDPQSAAETGVSALGRLGLAGRTGFYAILAAFVFRLAAVGHVRHQADANGALSLVSHSVLGKVAIAAVALGFVLLGAGRLMGAWSDHTVSDQRRALTAVQGVFYLGMAYIPASFLAGNGQTGSQQAQQKTTTQLIDFPGGRWLVAALGAVLVVVCAYQIRSAAKQEFRDGLYLAGAPRIVQRLAGTAGTVGIIARAVVFLPIGVSLILVAIYANPDHSVGTDQELLDLAQHGWGKAALVLIGVGLTVFVIFSAIETRYRQVVSAH